MSNPEIDEAFVARLVDQFYGRVRDSDLLGPIFAKVVGDDWDPHLATMKRFWSSVVLGTGRYHGRPVPAHTKLDGVTPEHFAVWLGLFRETVTEVAEVPATVEVFMEKANRIARSLQLAMWGGRGRPRHPALTIVP